MTYEHRRAAAVLSLVGPDGGPVADREVTIQQRRHAFEFGCAGFEVASADADYQNLWLGLFDTATLPVYWGRFEPVRGQPRTEQLRVSAQWYADHDVRLKGHPLVWHTVKAPWLDALPLDEAEDLLRARIRREVSDFVGLIDVWDVINEVVIMPRFTNEPDGIRNAITRICEERGRVQMVRLAVDEARSVGTSPRLVLNDFDLGPEYERLVAEVLDAGIEIDAIGLQSHMHQGFRGTEQLVEICDRFSRFGLPLHWTETTLLSGDPMPAEIDDLNDYVVESWPSTPEGEERQREEVLAHYTTLVGHPAVQSITYWGMGDAGTWLNAPAGLVRANGTPKPSYTALRDLVRGQWWHSPTTVRTDAAGRVPVAGFAGTYEIAAPDGVATVELERSAPVVAATLRPT